MNARTSPRPAVSTAPAATTSPTVEAQRKAGAHKAASASTSLALVTLPARLFLIFGWLRAAVEKGIDPQWWNGTKLLTFVDEQQDTMLSFMSPIVDAVVVPFAAPVAALVLLTQLGVTAMLLTTRRLGAGLVLASAMNVIFVLMGAVTPSAFYLVLQLTLLLAVAESTGWFNRLRRFAVVVGGGAFALAMTPFISTLHPAEVIHDPAIMLATVGALAAFTQAAALTVAPAGLRPTTAFSSAVALDTAGELR